MDWTFPAYLTDLVTRLAASQPTTLDQISGPIYQNYLDSVMSDDELGDLLEQAKHAMRAERRRKASAGG